MTADAIRILAVDLGEARIGLAISDALGLTAQPAGALGRRHSRRDSEAIIALARERGVGRIVLGLPLLLSGEVGTRAREAQAFADELRRGAPEIPVDLWDERFTTAEAERMMISDNVRRSRRRQVVDALAAVIILQSYLGGRPQPPGAA